MTISKEEADAQLRQAIEAHAEAYDLKPEEVMLDHFAVIASWIPVQMEGREPRTFYSAHFHTEYVPNHVAFGLFSIALDNLAGGDD